MTNLVVSGFETRVTVAQHVHAREFDGDLILLDLEAGEYFALNAVALSMWNELMRGRTPQEVAETLSSVYDVAREDLTRDCVKLVEELLRRGLVREAVP